MPDSFRGRRYDQRIMLDCSLAAFALADLLWALDEKARIDRPDEWAETNGDTNAGLARKDFRRIVRHDLAFASARRGLIPDVDEISAPPEPKQPKSFS